MMLYKAFLSFKSGLNPVPWKVNERTFNGSVPFVFLILCVVKSEIIPDVSVLNLDNTGAVRT